MINLTESVYPRWRGEHLNLPPVWGERAGLSPLARGTHHDKKLRSSIQRFIPAGAGNSPYVAPLGTTPPVYPRWRGELLANQINSGCAAGLSPLARGTQELDLLIGKNIRFIPAGAGNSPVPRECGSTPAVYPRWRGELFSFTLGNAVIYGLSPLARGTPRGQPPPLTRHRFIPAGAGNSLKVYICS